MSYLEILLLVHILSAIAGFGPTFSFAVLGPLAAKTGGPQALGILKGMVKIEKTLVVPAIVIQLVSGILLIVEAGWDGDFFSHYWLWIAIVLFLTAAFLALRVSMPATEKMIELGEAGRAESPEFAAQAKKAATVGPFLNVLLLVIIFLMVVKPGG
jgi:uncharacterized membrane protein